MGALKKSFLSFKIKKCILLLQHCSDRRRLGITTFPQLLSWIRILSAQVQNNHLELIQSLFENQWQLLHQFWCLLDPLIGFQSTAVKMKNIQTLSHTFIDS